MRIDLTAMEEAQLSAAAQESGLTPAELVKRLALQNLPDVSAAADDAVDARLSQWQEQDGRALLPDTSARELFARWAEEDASMTDEERRAEDQLWEDVQRSINATRSALGLRSV